MPFEERSRSSRRRRGVRKGVTLEERVSCSLKLSDGVLEEVLLWLSVLNGWEGGSAEDCGAGGGVSEVADMV